jgi:hypothetical protein
MLVAVGVTFAVDLYLRNVVAGFSKFNRDTTLLIALFVRRLLELFLVVVLCAFVGAFIKQLLAADTRLFTAAVGLTDSVSDLGFRISNLTVKVSEFGTLWAGAVHAKPRLIRISLRRETVDILSLPGWHTRRSASYERARRCPREHGPRSHLLERLDRSIWAGKGTRCRSRAGRRLQHPRRKPSNDDRTPTSDCHLRSPCLRILHNSSPA